METTNIPFMGIVLIGLLGLSAFFSGSETALMAVSKLRLRHLAETKPKRVRTVEKVLRKPEKLIGAILIGNNFVNVAMSALATSLAISIWGQKGIAYVTGILTLTILIFAEITPKVYAKYFNERVSFLTAPILRIVMITLNPFVVMVTFICNKLLLMVGIDVTKLKKPLMTEEEIRTCIRMGWDEGAISAEEKNMLSRVFTLNDRSVREIMVPRDKITFLDSDMSMEEMIRIILTTGYTRFPVKKGRDPEVIGFVHAKDLLPLFQKRKSGSLKKIIRPPYFIPADKTIDRQLRSFKARKLHQAVVLGEKGDIAGLVTLEDILEELVGSIRDEHDA